MKTLWAKLGGFIIFLIASYLLYLCIGYVISIIDRRVIIAQLLFYSSVILYCVLISLLCRWSDTGRSNKDESNKLAYVPWIIAIVVFLMSAFSLPYFYVKMGYPFWGYLAIGAVCLSLLLTIVIYFIVKYASWFRAKIVLRRGLFYSYYAALVIIFVGSINVVIDNWYDIPLHNYERLIYIVGVRSSDLYILVCTCFTGYMVFKKYSSITYILYLRNFAFDEESRSSETIDIISSSIGNIDLLRIGNPRTLFSFNATFTTFYLPDVNWQEEVSRLINKAYKCIIVLDVSEGVLWEMCNHLHKKEKFIYHISKLENLDNIISKLSELKVRDEISAFIRYLELIQVSINEDKTKSYTFIIVDNNIYGSSSIKSIVKYSRNIIFKNKEIPENVLKIEC